MKVMTLAAGMAVGYVLGSRAGREKYEQIVDAARKVGNRPEVARVQDKARELVGTGTDAVTAKLASVKSDTEATTADVTAPSPSGAVIPRPPRRRTVVTDPLV